MPVTLSIPPATLIAAFQQFLVTSTFARRTRESYTEDLAPLWGQIGSQPLAALTPERAHGFLASQT